MGGGMRRCGWTGGRWLVWLTLALASTCAAGPIATFRLLDGRRFSAEILGFSQGRFLLLDLAQEEFIEVPDAQVESVDFGEVHRSVKTGTEPPWSPPGGAPLGRRRGRRPLLDLTRWCLAQIRNGRTDRVEDLDRRISEELRRPHLSPERRRDLLLARLVVLSSLGRRAEAERLFERLSKEYRGDPVVERLKNWLQLSRTLRRPPPAGGRPREPRP